MPDIIQSFWAGNPQLSTMEQLCLRSFTAHGHEFHLYTYLDEIPNLPEGVVLKDANEVFPDGQMLWEVVGNWATIADIFRFKLLYIKGGWWVDMDMVALRPFESPDEFVFSSESDHAGNQITNIGVIKVPAGEACMEDCLKFIRLRGLNNLAWGDIGVTLFRKVLEEFESKPFIKPPEVYCPVNYWDLPHLVADTGYAIPAEANGVHLWNEMWRRHTMDKNARYHAGSIYEQLKKNYL